MRAPSILGLSVVCRSLRTAAAVAGLAIYAAAMSGCGHASNSPDDAAAHEHEEEGPPPTEADIDMPRDYSLAIRRIKEYRQQVLAAVAGGHPHERASSLRRDGPHHRQVDVDRRESGVPRTDWEEVNVARRELRRSSMSCMPRWTRSNSPIWPRPNETPQPR